MSFSKSTARALAASLAMVTAGATVAGAAVFHVPILGFGRTEVAAAASPRAAESVSSVRKRVRPKVIVKTRYVDDVVHRPAPATDAVSASTPSPTAVAFASASAPAPAVADTATTIAAPPTTTTPSTVAWTDDDSHEGSDHESSSHDGGDHSRTTPTTSTTSTTSTTVIDR